MNRDRYLAGICLIGRPNRQDHVVGLEWLEPRVLLSAAPVVTTTGSALAYTEHDGAVVIDVGLSVSDADSTNLVSATIAISANYLSGQDVLSFTNQLGITGSWDPDAGVLTLTGTALVAYYQTALESVTYTNTSHSPSTATRTVSFIASDDTAPSTPATRDVTVAGVNDAPTDLALSNATVAENQASGTTVGTLSTTDPDAGDTFWYALVPGTGSTDNTSFTLEGATLKTAAVFNHETKNSYSIRVRSTDQGNLWTEQVFAITVTDVNEAPVVNDQAFAVAENAALTTAVGTVVATDVDDGAVLSYAITAGNTGEAFEIDSGTGAITVHGALDHETLGVYSLTVEVTDNGTPGLTDTATVTLNVTDVNEAPVVNDQAFAVAENAALTTAVGTVVATDVDDGAVLSYAITAGNTGNAFAINAGSGQITVAGPLNHETLAGYTLTVEVTDNGTPGLTDTATVTLNVTDVNEAPVVNNQAFAVAENAALTTAVGTVVATDVDAEAVLSYAITAGNTGEAFEIDSGTGAITVHGALDHETLGVYSLTVEVTDSGDLSDTATVTVAVNDVNEAPVVNDQGFDVDENSIAGTVVGTVLATDVDAGDTRTYAITAGNTGNAFAINAETGEITIANASALNPATMPVFSLTVEVTDSGDLTDTATVSIGQRLPIGGGASAVFRDRQGKLVKIVLLGPGSGSVLLRGDRGWDVESITLTGTTARSWLRITTASYLVTTTVKDITVNGSLGVLLGPTTNVVGDIEISGTLQQLTLGDVTGPSTLGVNTDALTYAAPPQVRMTFGQVADCSIDTHGLAIGSLAATRWLNTDGADDTVSASGLGTLLVAGRRASLGHPAIAGDFEGSLRLTGFGASPRPTLSLARIAGTLADAAWNVVGNVGFLGAGAAADDFTAVVTGRIGVMNVPGNLSGTWTARSAGSLYVGGSLTEAVLTLTQEASPTSPAQTLGSLTVRKWIDGASVATAGHIGSIRAGAIRNSNVFAGVTQTRDLDSDGRADLPDPETDFDVLALAAIRTVVISGIRGEAAAFASSNIAAPNLGRIVIGTISDDNGGEAFGLAGRRLGSLRSASALTIPTAWPSYPCLGDFMVKVMSLRPAARG